MKQTLALRNLAIKAEKQINDGNENPLPLPILEQFIFIELKILFHLIQQVSSEYFQCEILG